MNKKLETKVWMHHIKKVKILSKTKVQKSLHHLKISQNKLKEVQNNIF